MSRPAGIEGKLHAIHHGRAVTLGIGTLSIGPNGWSTHGWGCSRCTKLGLVRIIEEKPVCSFCLGYKPGEIPPK